MNFPAHASQKADAALRLALVRARGPEVMRAVLVVEPVGGLDADVAPALHPQEFASRQAYRQALIDRRRVRVSRDVDPIRTDLQNLRLSVVGGETSYAVVVEGPASRIAKALELPLVRSAALDRSLPLIRPVRAATV